MTAGVRCITCARFSLGDARFNGDAKGLRLRREMTSAGFGNCAMRPRYTFESASFERVCAHHKPVEDADLGPRVVWLRKFEAVAA